MALLSTPLKQRVRSFLTDEGAPPSPNLSRNYDQIFALLQRRREDDEFWAPLTELLRDLVDSVVQGKGSQISARPEARLLALWDVKDLAQRLRVALPQADPPASAEAPFARNPQWAQLTRGISPNALGLFLLLSLAASACDSAPPLEHGVSAGGTTASGGTSNTGGGSSSIGGHTAVSSSTHAAGTTNYACARDAGTSLVTSDAGHPLPPNCCADTASELWKAIQDSTLAAAEKQTLYTCLSNLNATWCDGLVEMFKTASASVIATYLGNLLGGCQTGCKLPGDFAQAKQAVIEGMSCSVPLYKGVTFPS